MKIWLVLGLIGLASARAKGRAKEERLCQIPLVGKPDLRCDGEFRSWAFNTTSHQCERFVLTGCNIMPYTNSLYDSKHDCMSHCDKSNPLLQVEAPPTDFCYYPPTRGLIACMAYMPRWSFDVSAAQGPSCVKYIYGGCAGTENLFSNEKDCLAACGDAITKIKAQCPAREKITSCSKYCSGDRDCDGGQVCCPSHDEKCGPQCVPVATQQSSNGSLVTAEERTSLSLKTRATCEQPVEQGPCFAAIRKFAFKPEKNRCEVFIYGGCQGNDNNFDSASECQKTCGGDFANDDLACASVQCDTDSTRQYKDRNCIPQYTKGACCPTSYHCEDHTQLPLGEPEEQVCLYKGQSYKVGANISAATEDDPCFTCHCSSGPTPSPPFISCSTQPCPLLQDPPSTNCLLATIPGQCCSEWKCERASSVTCQANNQTYQEGDTFHITPCRKCICTANYTDENGYGCSDEVCIQQPPSPDCVPIYETGVCCPVDFHCPTNETVALNSTTQPNTDRVSFRPSFNESDCLLPSRVGRCKASFLRYYYDPATQKCKSFYYGGCSGNANRFETQWECEKACAGMAHEKPDKDLSPRTVANDVQTVDVCQQPKDVGPCRGYVPSFYYDSAKGKCERFFFGGCKGNGNRFDTVQECQKQCIKSSGRSGPSAEICKLPMVEGPCRAELRRFFFNATSQQCQYFNYGGCKGNENKFLTLALCEEQCKPNLEVETTTAADPLKPHVNLRSNSEGSSTKAPTPTSPSVPDLCSLPADVGPCKGHRSRYFYDSLAGQCRQFTYGGCKGNHNNFATQEECEATCQPAAPPVEPRHNNRLMPALGREQCKLPKDTGPCRMAVPRFYYNSQTSKCEPFTYGGCDGNANNYLTAEECQVRCGKGISRKEFDEIMGHRRPDQEQNPHTSARPKDTLRSTPKSHCALPADPGFCLAYMPRYYYNSETEKCERFIYGGCKGNANNFRTEEACLDSCGSQSSRKVSLPEESVCRFGNITLNRGDQLPVKDKCLDCICVTPPGLTCTRKACAIQPRKPFIPNVPDKLSSVDHDSDEKDEPKKDSGENQDQEQVEAKQNSSEETRGDDD